MSRYIVLAVCLLLVPPGHANPVYKFVDANGAVSYADEPPAHDNYEIIDVAVLPPSSTLAEVQARQAQMQTATDKIASARKAREQARQLQRAKTNAGVAQYSPYPLVYTEPAPVYHGYPYYRGRGHFQRPAHNDRPVDQIDPPPARSRLPSVPVIPR